VKLAIIGAGSTYVPLIVDEIRRSGGSSRDRISLFDVHDEAVSSMVASPLWARHPVTVTKAASLPSAVDEADVNILIFRAGPPGVRPSIERLATQSGLLAQETQGACGFFSALLNISALVDIAHAIRKYSPNSLTVIVTNPTGIVTAAAQELGLNAVGLCELPFGMHQALDRWARKHDLARERSVPQYFGLNHFGWMLRADTSSGTDLVSKYRREVGFSVHVPPSIPTSIALEADVPTCPGLPNPYIGYLNGGDNGDQSRRDVAELASRSIGAIGEGNWDTYTATMRLRGGFLVGAALANLLSLVKGTDGTAIVCTRSPDAWQTYDSDAAFERTVSYRSGSFVPHRIPQELSAEAGAFLRLIARYEADTVVAALGGDTKAALNALALNPFIAPGAQSREALRDFYVDYSPYLEGRLTL